jgi:hypothetical protein
MQYSLGKVFETLTRTDGPLFPVAAEVDIVVDVGGFVQIGVVKFDFPNVVAMGCSWDRTLSRI